MQRAIAILILATTIISVGAQSSRAQAPPPNIVILLSDDQRFDMLSQTFTPEIWTSLVTAQDPRFPAETSVPFTNSFVPNPLCCPSRTSILTGRYSHTTGVWDNGRKGSPYGGFKAFNDSSTIATDFQAAGYRTAMIGKYLNRYVAGRKTYVPPGWDTWFAVKTGAYYDYGVTATGGQLLSFGSTQQDYITDVLSAQATTFVNEASGAGQPFFLYYSFTAPHGPSIPDPRDVGRFDGVATDTPVTNTNMLNAAYGVDRAVGELLNVLPANTIVLYMSDNGYLWGEHGYSGKQWPYNESIRVPIVLTSLDGSYTPVAAADDLVLNIDLRPTLTAAAGVPMLSSAEGIDWGASGYQARSIFPIEHYGGLASWVPSYCGVREKDWMYARYANGTELLFDDASDPAESVNLVDDPTYDAVQQRLHDAAVTLCSPTPPGYAW
jgi:N-acetylglucosamine-6-sulfatase